MKFRLIFPLLLFTLLIAVFAYKADDDPFNALLKKLEVYNEKYPQEKVHLHLDKPYYAIGDDIWFKAYVINTQTSKLSAISSALYVELINEKDSVKKQLKLPLVSGVTWGDFKLPDSLTEGNYRIRAYTQWMRNAGPDFFFDKTIKIGNSWANNVFTSTNYTFSKQNASEKVNAVVRFTDKNGKAFANSEVTYEVVLNFRSITKAKAVTNDQGAVNINFLNTQPSLYKSGKIVATLNLPDKKKVIKQIPIKATSNAVDVQFFPESGNLVENLPCKVAVKAVNASGLGEDIEGVIVDNTGLEVYKFSTKHLGMGSLFLNPQPGKTYSAKIKFKDGSEGTFNLPKVSASGYLLAVTQTDENVVAKILLSPDLVGSGELKIVAQNNSNVYFVSRAAPGKQIITTSIPKKELPTGIIQFTVFSAANMPLCERLIFINNSTNKIDLKAATTKQSYTKREKVDLNLEAAINNKPLEGTFSIAVTNTASVVPDEENESNIFTSLLLTSDIMGYVEKPNYYFLKNDTQTQQDLDNLMLTQGWRRILWKNIISGLPPNIRFEAEKTLKISGTVTTYGGKPSPNSKVSLFSSSGGFFATDTVSDAQGRFSFDNIVFNDSTKFIVQARNARNKKSVDIKMDLVAGQVVTKNKNSGDVEVNINEALSSYLKQSDNFFEELTRRGLLERSITLKEVNIVEKKNPAKNSSNLNGGGNADAVITAEQLQNCTTLSMCLQGRVAGLMIRDGKAYLLRNGNTPMQIVIDGMMVEPDFLDNITPFDIETIEVLKSVGNTAIYGMRGGGGVLVITTKRGGGTAGLSSFTPGIITFSPKGFYTSRQFYSPKYEVATNTPDLRTTIYWAPHVATKDGKGTVSYYNADQPGTYRVVVEGADLDGNLGRAVYTYEVK
ncbi:MAG TPA: TonB-dependent receptor plug domain-containing protein [Pedobacter sp.]|uniref:carboxypeptidase-like regulatory domain-containing protein n=1 Tax=Pedobacter sp. TaxID=1411316 RepID=UPI002C0919E7|nr:TonB-dependent receptor plug domain-containing protein [Pedobacter sp.]HMI03156.1 TonB-dependent receptor plug domain-containing protein [Pedobacter sp.]